MSQVERLYWLDAALRAGQAPSWQAIQERWEVGRRTVFNDIRFLRDRLGAPVAFDAKRGGYVYTRPNYQLPFLAFTDAEADALRRVLLAAHASLPPADAAAVRHLTVKLSPYIRRLPVQGEQAGQFGSGSEWFVPGQPAPSAEAGISDELLADVRRAVDERRRLRLTYYSAHSDTTTERVVQPYLLLNWRGELYLVAHCETRRDLRDFFLPRIRAHALLDPPNAFSLPSDWNPEHYLHQAFEMRRGEASVRVRVRFSPFQSRWARERRYHPSQETEAEADGSLIVTLHVAGLADVKRWVLSFGAEVEVLEPDALRVQVAGEADRLRHLYRPEKV